MWSQLASLASTWVLLLVLPTLGCCRSTSDTLRPGLGVARSVGQEHRPDGLLQSVDLIGRYAAQFDVDFWLVLDLSVSGRAVSRLAATPGGLSIDGKEDQMRWALEDGGLVLRTDEAVRRGPKHGFVLEVLDHGRALRWEFLGSVYTLLRSD